MSVRRLLDGRLEDYEVGSLQDGLAWCHQSLQALSFWLAIVLPAIYLPLLVATSVVAIDPAPILYVIGVHVVTLVLGHRYTPSSAHVDHLSDDS